MTYPIIIDILFVTTCIVIAFLISKLLGRQKQYVGNIVVLKTDEKTTYSLELDDNPEIIESRKEVTFKVIIPDVESDRK